MLRLKIAESRKITNLSLRRFTLVALVLGFSLERITRPWFADALHGIAAPPLPGISTVSEFSSKVEASAEDAGAPEDGLDPRPDAPTDPQPLRGPHP